MTDWQTGTARVLNVRGGYVIVSCPHCRARHAHKTTAIGSREIVAACHTPARPRSYAIPANGSS